MGYSSVAKVACKNEPDLLQVCPVLHAPLPAPSGVGHEPVAMSLQMAMSLFSWPACVKQGHCAAVLFCTR